MKENYNQILINWQGHIAKYQLQSVTCFDSFHSSLFPPFMLDNLKNTSFC